MARFAKRFAQNRGGVVGAEIVLAFIAMAILAPWLAPYDPNAIQVFRVLDGPSGEHLLGTDEVGRDVLSRIIWGSRYSLAIGIFVVALSGSVGILLGVTSAYVGSTFDLVVQRLIDFMMALPTLLLALVVIAILGPGLIPAMFAVAIARIPDFTRIARGSALAVQHQEFVESSRALGQRGTLIVLKHILPNCIGPLVVQATMLIASAILVAASLGFLGLGAQPPLSEWGTMVSTGRAYLRSDPHVFFFPSIALAVVIFGFNLMGDGLRDALDVRMKV